MKKFISIVVCLFLSLEGINSLPLVAMNDEKDNQIGISQTESPDSLIDLSAFNNSIFGSPNNKIGEVVSNWTPEDDVNPEELGSYLEGDLLIPPNTGRNGLVAQSTRWPGGVIPFVIQGDFNAFEMNLIEKGINEYHSRTCLRFKPRTNERDYVAIVNGASGCWSSVGRVGGRQEVNLQTPACLSKVGTFIHEMMHAIGFFHEQNRYDRDGHVTIKYENIVPGTTSNFDKTSSNKAHAFGVPYDYGSVMHYSAYAFSRNGNPTIIPKQAVGRNQMGQRNGFSQNDVQKINKMYNCRGTYSATSVEGASGTSAGNVPQTAPKPIVEQPNRPSLPGFNIPFLPFFGGLISSISNIFGDQPGNITRIAVIDIPPMEVNEIDEIGQNVMML